LAEVRSEYKHADTLIRNDKAIDIRGNLRDNLLAGLKEL